MQVAAAKQLVRRWIQARCEDAERSCRGYIQQVDPASPFHQNAICWLFAEGNLTHVLLNAGERNPTVRKRDSAVAKLLRESGQPEAYDSLLAMLGCEAMCPARVEHHHHRMTEAFDRSAAVIRSPFPFACNLSPLARPIAIDGSRESIDAGEHREVMFWIAVTYARCVQVLESDRSAEVAAPAETGFREMLRDLGIDGTADMQRRGEEIERFLPELKRIAEGLISSGSKPEH